MEVVLRCALPDRPGALAALAGAVGAAGGDIQAVDVVEHEHGAALDDFIVVLASEARLADVVAGVAALDGFEVIHVGPSRGHPADAVARVALGLEAALSGTQAADEAARTLVGGLLRADRVEFVEGSAAPRETATRLVEPFGDRSLVVRRAYRFTATERWRAQAILRACTAAANAQPDRPPSSRSG
jgi:hypothetical protein